MKNYGTRIKDARKTSGITQIEAAMKAGVSQQTWQRYKAGKLDLKMSSIYNICKTLNISADWLLGLTEEKP